MLNKVFSSVSQAVADIKSGSSVMVSGFGGAGLPFDLIEGLLDQGATGLTIISNNAGSKGAGIAKLVAAGRVQKVICSFPRQPGSDKFDELYRTGKIELELVPQGTLAERIRAGGAGIGAFFTPTGIGTKLAKGKEVRLIRGVEHLLEQALTADFALIKANLADRWGNLTYRGTARNFGPVMAAAAACTIVQVNNLVQLGDINPEHVVTPSLYVNRVVLASQVLL